MSILEAVASGSNPTRSAYPSSTYKDGNAKPNRLASIDVFRGILVASMILVTNPGTYDYVYWPLLHAQWNGATPTDMIFPSFLFLVGVSISFSFVSRLRRGQSSRQTARHVLLRSIGLIVLGLLLNSFDLLHVPNLRIPGVLQRIGLCYCFGGFVYLAVQSKRAFVRSAILVSVMSLLLVVYWCLQTMVPVPGYGVGRLDPVGTLSAYIDRAVFTTKHLWHWGGPGQVWDPEGLLTTLPAIANLLLGVLAGDWLRSRRSEGKKVIAMVVIGCALMAAGALLNPVIPINKKIWTDSFMFLSGGFSLVAFGLSHWIVDLSHWAENRRGRLLLTPALIYGSNAVLGFSLANILSPLLGVLQFKGENGAPTALPGLGFQWFSHFLNPWNASLAYAVAFVLLIMAILWPLYRRGIFVRL